MACQTSALGRRVVLSIVLVVPLLLVACQRTMVATPTLYSQGGASPFGTVPASLQSPCVNILYITDRARDDKKEGETWYGYGRSQSLAYGTCEVHLGKSDDWNALVADSLSDERKGSYPLSIGKVEETGRLPVVPGPRVIQDGKIVDDPSVFAERVKLREQFQEELARRLSLTDRKDVYFFVHGFNNKFQHPMLVMAQLWHFMGRQGVPIVYTWPAGSGTLLRGYTHDRESGEFTVYHLKQVILAMAACPEVERIHVIGHSRGTDILTTALRELNIAHVARGEDAAEKLKLANVILAAADLDMEVTSQRISAELLPLVADRFTVYVSKTDKALGIATFLFKSGRRLGQFRYDDMNEMQRHSLSLVPGLQIIDVVAATEGNGHSYFYNHPGALSDVIAVLRDDLDPNENGGRPLKQMGPGYWELTDDYLKPEGEGRHAQPISDDPTGWRHAS